MGNSRREFIRAASTATAGTMLSGKIIADSGKDRAKEPVCAFTKCLQFVDYELLGEKLAWAGFDGADIAIRPDGYIRPENVATELPKLQKVLRKYNISIPMMVTSINNADDPLTEKVLGTASELGIRYYRTSFLLYDSSRSIQQNLDAHRKTFEKLEKINRKFNIHGGYQNHSGVRVGGPVWDLYMILKDLDPAHIGVQYDICHAVCEGGVSWPLGLKLLAPWVKMTDIKDCIWEKVNGAWKITYLPLGSGMVNFDAYLNQLNHLQISGPVSIHFEYDLGGAELGRPNPKIGLGEIISLMKKDREWLENKVKRQS